MSLYRLCIPSGGELLSALVAASLDDVAAALSLHALPESVDLAALTLFGLECPFHSSDLSGLFCRGFVPLLDGPHCGRPIGTRRFV